MKESCHGSDLGTARDCSPQGSFGVAWMPHGWIGHDIWLQVREAANGSAGSPAIVPRIDQLRVGKTLPISLADATLLALGGEARD